MKRFGCVIVALVFGILQMPTASAVGTCASAAVLMDADSGRVLYAHNPHETRSIASVTKLLTALVALESEHTLDEVVSVRQEWVGVEGSSIYLQPGEQITLEALLYGLLLRSGNDAAVAVAEYCAGTEEDFVAAMNKRAEELGMKKQSFRKSPWFECRWAYLNRL